MPVRASETARPDAASSAGRFFERASSALIGLLFPVLCPICSAQSRTHAIVPLCDQCWAGIEAMTCPRCSRCSKPLGSQYAQVCGACLVHEPPFKSATCYGHYEGALREAIHQLKFSGFKRLARPLGAMLASMKLPEADVIIPVPVGLGALRERGFNHCFYLGRELARHRGMKVDSETLWKVKEIPPQVGLSMKARLSNVKGAFGMRRKLSGERVLLVDDVITTGATVSECSKVLLRAGAGEVVVAALGRV